MPLTGVAGTAEVAARGKLAAVRAGYYSDPYAECFVTGECTRPGPLINRGHHLRVAVIQSVVSQFLDAVGPREAQIISLGAGFDTRFWTLSADADSRPGRYIELDQAEVVERKAALIAARPSLLAALPEGSRCVGPSGVASRCGYHLAATDVRQPAELEAALSAAGWEPAAPTLVLAECCLVYLPAPASAALLAWFASRSRCAAFLAYEQIRPDDAFGRTMLENLRRRGIPLLGLRDCPDLAAQVARCEAAGWGRAEAEDLLQLYGRAVTARERARLARLERLDEVEEWQLMLSHYCAALAVCEEPSSSLLARLRLLHPIGAEAAADTADEGEASRGSGRRAPRAFEAGEDQGKVGKG